MYQYNTLDRTLIRERANQFRQQVRRHLGGELNEDEFKCLRLRNGLYKELHAHMLRVAIPYGVMSAQQLRTLAWVARHYDKGYGHFTTRQNIQFNWPRLEQAADILDKLGQADMHAIQTSGNCIRNITTDHLAGVAQDEIEDPRPYCEILRQWSTLHPEFLWLPRKFKIAFSGAKVDRAATAIHDIGVRMVHSAEGEIGFRILVGGGLGRKPYLGQVIKEFLPKHHLLSYLEAILRVYNLQGRRDNLHKARIKILVNALGLDRFRVLVDVEWNTLKNGRLRISDKDIERMKAHFTAPPYETGLSNRIIPLDLISGNPLNTAYSRWLKYNTTAHKVQGYRIVFVSLKHPDTAPGDASAEQMEAVANLAEQYSFGEIRVSHEQNLLLAHVKESDLPKLWQGLHEQALATPNIGTLNDIICCPGLDY